jgi:hypothetical protein
VEALGKPLQRRDRLLEARPFLPEPTDLVGGGPDGLLGEFPVYAAYLFLERVYIKDNL